jgi:type II secretory pathway pseudopilin PulG
VGIKMKKSQDGFSAVEGLLIIIIIGILGGVGWYVWNSQKQVDKTYSQTANSSVSPKTKNTSSSAALDSSPSYFVIKEWGVKVPVTDSNVKYYYKFDKSYSTIINVYSQKADGIVGPKGVSCKEEYIAYVLRLEASSPDWNDPEKVSPLFDHKITIGKYAFAVATKKEYGPDCFDAGSNNNYVTDQTTSAKFDAIVSQFVKDFQSIKAE